MSLTLEQATEEVHQAVADFFLGEPTAALFLVSTEDGHDALQNPMPGVIFDDTPGRRPDEMYDDGSGLAVLPWARVSLIDGDDVRDPSFAARRRRRYRPSGVLVVQLFMRRGMGQSELRPLGGKLVTHLRNHSGSVAIRHPRFRPIADAAPQSSAGDMDSPWKQGNVIAEYDYHQLG